MRIFHYISILLCVALVGVFIYQYSPHYKIISGEIFGTYYNIKIRGNISDPQLKNKITTRLQEINSLMSVFDADSEISHINNAPAHQPIELSSPMSYIMQASELVYRQTGGYFDPSLGKLIDLWGFGASSSISPSPTDIKQALDNSGFAKLQFSKDFNYLLKSNSQMMFNLSAIAKGWAVDEIALLLDQEGYENYLIEIGGEIKAKGYREENGEPWSIGINRPDTKQNFLVVSLSNMAVATSGNYRNFYTINGKVLGHTISFQSGEPVTTDVASVSVFHSSCMYADAYATAIVAMGVKPGLEFADRYDLKVIIIDNNMQKHLSSAAQHMFKDSI